MFTKNWREHWGLKEDPFACEDADKDMILSEIEPTAVHSSFDRMLGNPLMPSPAIVFGEKGSGKSALRLLMRRHISDFNKENPDKKIFPIEYIDFNSYIEHFRRVVGAGGDDRQAALTVVNQWRIGDHMDAILSLGVTDLVDRLLAGEISTNKLTRKQKVNFMLLSALYYNSSKKNTVEVLEEVKKKLGGFSSGSFFMKFLAVLFTLVGVGVALFPYCPIFEQYPDKLWYGLGGGIVLLTWLLAGWRSWSFYNIASSACKNIKLFPRNPSHLAKIIKGLNTRERKEFVLPNDSDESSRFQLLQRFAGILEDVGYKGIYVLVDRIDEPSLLSPRVVAMREFVERILDIKLLQYQNLGLKLFLPIELDEIHRNATPDQLKRMRLDKSNLIPEFKWNGQELYEISNQRMLVCKKEDSTTGSLKEIFADDFPYEHLRDTLNTLGTPRYAFGFLSSVIAEHIRNLPNDLPEDDPRWKITQAHFDVVRAGWIDRSGVLRRVLN